MHDIVLLHKKDSMLRELVESALGANNGSILSICRKDDLQPGRLLLSCGTDILVPNSILERCDIAYNCHPGPPAFPGRDPHHWAIYHEAKTFGVTLHRMTQKVDQGPIVATLRFPIPPSATPDQLRYFADSAAAMFSVLHLNDMLDGPLIPNGEVWGKVKHRRSDLKRMCKLDGVDAGEAARRRRAFAAEGYENFD